MEKENFVLEQKLKRLKISYANENGKIVVGKPKVDYFVTLGLVILPAIASFVTLWFILTYDVYKGKVFALLLFLASTSIFYLNRTLSKKKNNGTVKRLMNNSIVIEDKTSQQRFDSYNIKEFNYNIREISEDTLEGVLYLIDTENNHHKILGFDDENEQYLRNDLNWFIDYFSQYTQIKK